MDLTTLTAEELDALRVRVLTEQERRNALVAIPTQIEQLASQYERSGGVRTDLNKHLEKKATK